MHRYTDDIYALGERGLASGLEASGRRSETHSTMSEGSSSRSDDQSQSAVPCDPRDFDDGANALWSLYGKEAQAHDKTLFQNLSADMDGVPTFAGLFAAVITSFLINSLQNLQPDPAQQALYYHQQSVAMLAHISQQIASIAPQLSIQPTPPPPAFRPSAANIRVNAYWLIGLVCSLSAALFATLVQQWVRSYMKVFQRYDHPLKRARFRQFFFEGARPIRAMAIAVPSLIRFSLALFLFGLCDYLLSFNTIIGAITIVPIFCSALFFLYGMLAPHSNLQSPHRTLLSWPIFFLMQTFQRPNIGDRSPSTSMNMEACQERVVMEETNERKDRDVRAIRWLIDSTAVNVKMEPLVLAIPGSFNTQWGKVVWREVSSQARDTSLPLTASSPAGGQGSLIIHPSHPLLGAAADTISRCVRYLFETCNNHSHFESEEARRRRMRVCVEAVASLVCCCDFRLDWFGDVGKLVSEIGCIEQVNQSPVTTSDQSFIIRWTCLSLVAVQQILSGNRMRGRARNAVSGLARFRLEYGQPEETAWRSIQSIEEYLKTAWEYVEDLRRAFEPWTQRRTLTQVQDILRRHERQISELERMKAEANGMEDIDLRISHCQDAMDEATYRFTRQLPGVSFDELRRSEPVLISDAFGPPATCTTSVTPQLIFPGQRVQALARLGPKLREVLDGQAAEGYEKVLESLKSVDQVPVSRRRPDGLRRQLWRLQDLQDGGGLGFTVELFFLSLRQLISYESNSVFYTGTFEIIKSRWREGVESLGTQCILLDIISDLIIRGRGDLSDVLYPEPIPTMLLEMIGDVLQERDAEHIRNAVQEIRCVDSRTCIDTRLWSRALKAIS